VRTAIQDTLFVLQALAVIGCSWSWIRMVRLRNVLAAMVDDWHGDLQSRARDHMLVTWMQETKITVNTVTGTWVSMTLAELANSSVPHRSWNVPISVELHPRDRYVGGVVDEDQAKEHRG
jgi:hypothetical protein